MLVLRYSRASLTVLVVSAVLALIVNETVSVSLRPAALTSASKSVAALVASSSTSALNVAAVPSAIVVPLTLTVALADLLVPSVDVALIVTVPGATAVTTPLADTVAIEASEVVHTSALLGFLPLVLTVALIVVVSPGLIATEVGLNVTFVTLPATTLTVTVAFFFLFFLEVTVILAEPTFLALITPFFVTVATLFLEDL